MFTPVAVVDGVASGVQPGELWVHALNDEQRKEIPVRRSRILEWAASLAGMCLVGAGLTGYASTDAATTNAVDAVAAIQQVAPDAVSGVAATTQTGEGAAVSATVEDTHVAVPTDPATGVSLGDVTVGLPFAGQASDAVQSQKPGVVAYDNNNGSTTVPVIHQDGRVQISTVIENANAPKRYDYPTELATGQSLQLSADGSAYVADEDGTPVVYIAAPWAKDANGGSVATHYEVNGDTLTQVIDFTADTAFPVVADPSYGFYWWGWVVKYNRADTKTIAGMSSGSGSLSVLCGLISVSPQARVACGAASFVANSAWFAPARSAATHGNCLQFNVTYPSIPGVPLLYEVKC